MKRVISRLTNIRLRQIVTILLVALTFLVSTNFDLSGNSLQAQAANYNVNSSDEISKRAERVKEDAEKSAKLLEEEGIKVTNRAAESDKDPNNNLIDSIREKLNLDEPIDPGTKQFVEQAKDATSEALPIPGGR